MDTRLSSLFKNPATGEFSKYSDMARLCHDDCTGLVAYGARGKWRKSADGDSWNIFYHDAAAELLTPIGGEHVLALPSQIGGTPSDNGYRTCTP